MGTEARATLALAVAVFSISWASILARLASVHGIVAAWWRLTIGVAVTAVAWGAMNRRLAPSWKAAVAGLTLSLHFTLWLESLNHTTVAASTAIVSTYPVYTAIVETLTGRPPRGLQVAGIALALTGVGVLLQPWASGGTVYGSLLALGGAVAGSAYFLLGRAARLEGIDTLTYTLQAYAAALVASTAYGLVLGVNPLAAPVHSIPYLILLGIVPMLGGHTLLNYSLRYYSATTVTSLTLLEPFGATLLAALILAEQPPPLALPALVAAVTGSAAVVIGEKG